MGGPSLRLQPGLQKAGAADTLLGKGVHLTGTLGWTELVSRNGCRKCALQSVHSAKQHTPPPVVPIPLVVVEGHGEVFTSASLVGVVTVAMYHICDVRRILKMNGGR